MSFIVDEIKHLLRCAHCLNHGADQRVVIETKKAPNGDDIGKGPNGEAVAYMCTAHKDIAPKFVHQFLDGNVNVINVEQLADMPAPTQPEVQQQPKFSKDEMSDEEE